jgi:hypothetical protein
VRNEVGLDVSHHARISQRGGEKLFYLTSSFIGRVKWQMFASICSTCAISRKKHRHARSPVTRRKNHWVCQISEMVLKYEN